MLLAVAALILSGCSGSGPGGDSGECAAAPVVTYASFGEGFVREQCAGCHASTSANRYGAPDGVTFDTVDEIWARKDEVLNLAGTDTPTMPPDGGTTADDRTRLHWWLDCAPSGT